MRTEQEFNLQDIDTKDGKKGDSSLVGQCSFTLNENRNMLYDVIAFYWKESITF